MKGGEEMNNRLWVVVIAVLVVGGLIYLGTQAMQNQNLQIPANPQQGIGGAGVVSETPQSAQEVKTFEVDGKPFEFSVKEMRVKMGDRVKVTFTNKEGFHDFVIDEFDARTKQIQAGGSDTVEFTADRPGTFEYYCSVGNHRGMGMKGNLIVE